MIAAPIRHERLDLRAVIIVAACCTLWGLNQVAAKVALVDIPPLTQASVRSLGAALLVLAWARWRGIGLFQRDGSLPGGLLAGALFALEFACIFIGLQHTSASRMAVFIYLSPFVVALGMPFIARGERLSPVQWAGLLLAFGGVAFALADGFRSPASGPRQWLGDALGVAAAVLWAGTTLVIRGSRLAAATAEKTLAYQLVVSGVLLGVAAALQGGGLPVRLSALSVGSMVFQTVIVTFASYLAWFWLLRHYPATRIATFTLLTPVAGLLFGVALLGEPLTSSLVLALATVAGGIALVNRR